MHRPVLRRLLILSIKSLLFLFLFNAGLLVIHLRNITEFQADYPAYLNISFVSYRIQPERIESECGRGRIWLMILVHSAVNHTEHRKAIRETWASITGLDGKQIRTVFLLGMPRTETEEEAVVIESKEHDDILQGDFLDTYRNLSVKNIMGLNWLTKTCEGVQLVLKSDDDVFLNLFGIYTVVKEQLSWLLVNETIAGFSSRKSLVHRTGRYGVAKSAYPAQFYPEHCVGIAYLLTFEAARSLVMATLSGVAHFSVDDAYLGVLRRKTNITLHKLNHIYSFHQDKLLDCVEKSGRNCGIFIGPTNPANLTHMWRLINA